MLSIIIPTLNEEKHLPPLLDSIKKQKFSNYEIIVADAGSSDKTRQIAEAQECYLVRGGLPARGKNEGAKNAKGQLFLFLDADVILPDNFIKKALAEFKKKKVDIASFCLGPCDEKAFPDLIYNLFYNLPIVALEKFLPHAATAILIKKKIFEKLGGFDETIKLAEDHDLARRVQKIGKCGILKSVRVLISDRRFKEDGWLKTGLRYFLCELHMIFKGPVRSDIFEYKFDHYSKNKKNKV